MVPILILLKLCFNNVFNALKSCFYFILIVLIFFLFLKRHDLLFLFSNFFLLIINLFIIFYLFSLLESIKKNYAYLPYVGRNILYVNIIIVITCLELLILLYFGVFLIQRLLIVKDTFVIYTQLLPGSHQFSYGFVYINNKLIPYFTGLLSSPDFGIRLKEKIDITLFTYYPDSLILNNLDPDEKRAICD